MDPDEVIRTIIRESPGIKSQHLLQEVNKKTHLEKSAIFSRLKRLVRLRKIFRKNGHYFLEPPEGALRRAYEKHIIEIISGLLVLAEKGRYTLQGGIVPDPSFAEYARQHLKSGYSSIFSLELTNKKLFLERVSELIEELKLKYEKLRGNCEQCQELFKCR